MATAETLRELAALLDQDDVYDLVVGAMAEARDKAPRHPSDVDSAVVLDHAIAAVRVAADTAT